MKSLSIYNKPAVKYLYEKIKADTRTVTGKNIREILMETNSDCIEDIKVQNIKKHLSFKQIADEDKWKLNILKELVNVKQNNMEINFDDGENFSFNDIDDMINYITTT